MLKLLFMPFKILFFPFKLLFSFFSDHNYDENNNEWGLSKEDKKIAKEERMSDADYIEAEERDDDNLDYDD